MENLGPTVNGGAYDGEPAISPTGLALFFATDRPGGSGGTDLWVATRKSRSELFGEPTDLGPGINTPGLDGRPALSGDAATLFLMSDRAGGSGGIDIWQVAIHGA